MHDGRGTVEFKAERKTAPSLLRAVENEPAFG